MCLFLNVHRLEIWKKSILFFTQWGTFWKILYPFIGFAQFWYIFKYVNSTKSHETHITNWHFSIILCWEDICICPLKGTTAPLIHIDCPVSRFLLFCHLNMSKTPLNGKSFQVFRINLPACYLVHQILRGYPIFTHQIIVFVLKSIITKVQIFQPMAFALYLYYCSESFWELLVQIFALHFEKK